MNKSKPDYGIDAPIIRLSMIVIAIMGFLICVGSYFYSLYVNLTFSNIAIALIVIGIIIFIYGFFMSSYMTISSRFRKIKAREKLLDRVENFLNFDDIELGIDVGCGRGLMLIGAAKRMKRGKVIGFDLWINKDQSNNNPEETQRNVNLEKVSDLVEIKTADARNLPLGNNTVDLVMSHWVVHNIEPFDEQIIAINEQWRVLRKGGILILADIANVEKYSKHLAKLGAENIEFDDGGLEAKLMGFLSGGTFVPQTLICQRLT